MCCCNISLCGVNTSKDIDYQTAKLLFRTELGQYCKKTKKICILKKKRITLHCFLREQSRKQRRFASSAGRAQHF